VEDIARIDEKMMRAKTRTKKKQKDRNVKTERKRYLTRKEWRSRRRRR
jgi:hypothetical protein